MVRRRAKQNFRNRTRQPADVRVFEIAHRRHGDALLGQEQQMGAHAGLAAAVCHALRGQVRVSLKLAAARG